MLVLSGRVFYPATTGGTTRSSRLFERLARDHDITIVSFKMPGDSPESLGMMQACCSRLETVDWNESAKGTPRFYADVLKNVLSPKAFTVAKYDSPDMRRRIARLVERDSYDVLIADFLQPSINMLDTPFFPKILFQHNVESVVRRRQLTAAGNPLLKAYLYWDLVRLNRFEARAAGTFDHCIMVSEQDCRTMQELYGVTNTSAIPTGAAVRFVTTNPTSMVVPGVTRQVASTIGELISQVASIVSNERGRGGHGGAFGSSSSHGVGHSGGLNSCPFGTHVGCGAC